MATATETTVTAARAGDADSERVTTHLVDTDVHEGLRSLNDLVPYLDPVSQRWVREYVTPFPGGIPVTPSQWPYAIPSHSRNDWVEEDEPFPGTDLDQMRRHLLEGEGVTVAILNGMFHPSAMVGNFEFASALARAYNDWQVDVWLDREPRLRGSIHVVAHRPDEAVREIERLADHPQIVQVFLPTVTDRQYGDPFYWPIFEAAMKHDLPVAFHHAVHTQTVLGYPRYYIEWHTTAAPQAAQNQLLSLICNGLFDRYPELKVVFMEAGVGWVPWFIARLDQQFRELRAEVPWVKRMPSDHMRDCVRISTQPLSDIKPGQFARMVEETETERLFLFATDYPHYDADSADNVLPKSMPEELRRRVRWQNAAETFPKLRDMLV